MIIFIYIYIYIYRERERERGREKEQPGKINRTDVFIIYCYHSALLLVNGDYFLGTVLSTTLTKLALRYSTLVSDAAAVNARRAEAMLIMTSIIRVGQSQFVTHNIDEDSYDRIMQDIRVVGNRQHEKAIDKVYLEDSRNAFAKQIQAEEVNTNNNKNNNSNIK